MPINEQSRRPPVEGCRLGSFALESTALAKTSRKSPGPGASRTVKTSLVLDSHLHSRISALASLRGCTINALLVEAAEEVARQITVIDRRKPAVQGDVSGLVTLSAPDAA
jgi:hypothetical protein